MADDRQLSQLISRSLRHELSGDEKKQVQEHLDQNEESRKFSELSKTIQNSVAVNAKNMLAGGQTDSPALSVDAKQRLKDSLSKAMLEKGQDPDAEVDPQEPVSAVENETSDQREIASRFQLLRFLNKGGIGNIWLARDKKLNRTLAIKELHREALESPQAWERFRREAEITGHLEHPNVVPIYQYGEDRKTGEPFYAMRFVGKRTLADAIVEHHDRLEAGEECGMENHRLLSVFLDICQAIAYAHSRGVIHRDLKPENVALDNFGQVIVLDWGLAKVLEDGELADKMTSSVNLGESTLRNTMQGDVVGTPLYMSPEQASGNLGEVDDKTDVYGLGAILFAILVGKAPHENSVVADASELSSVLKSIAGAETPRPRDYRKNIPQDLEAICIKAMARKRHLRFDSVQHLADAVERWMAGQSGKKAVYDNLRMEGRELRADMQSAVRDLERNVRFMSNLPPIQELIEARAEEDISVWRERLGSIFYGLLRANPDYRNVVYCRVDDNEFTELVRVERHSTDATSIRVVPRTRLGTRQINELLGSLVTQKPDEVLTSLVSDPLCDKASGCEEQVGLVAGVPVYNEKTEDVYGIVMINCDASQLLQRQVNRRLAAAEVVVACDVVHTLIHTRSGQLIDESNSRPVVDVASCFQPAVEWLQTHSEYIDEANSDIYGARLWLNPNQHGVMYLLRRNRDQAGP